MTDEWLSSYERRVAAANAWHDRAAARPVLYRLNEIWGSLQAAYQLADDITAAHAEVKKIRPPRRKNEGDLCYNMKRAKSKSNAQALKELAQAISHKAELIEELEAKIKQIEAIVGEAMRSPYSRHETLKEIARVLQGDSR